MSIPAWLLDVFAAVMLLVVAVSAAQLVAGYRSRWARVDADITVSHLLMGIAMAGMLVTGLQTLPTGAWEVVFAVLTAWFAWSAWRRARGAGFGALAGGHYAPHLVHSAAMLYTFLALAAPRPDSGMSGMATLRLPTLAVVFVLLLAAYTVRDLDRWAGSDGYFHVLRPSPAPASAAPALTTPALATAGSGAARPEPEPVTAPAAQPAAAASGEAAWVLYAPGVVKACRVTMGVTMAFMLVIMI